jgi:hypothetical protein
MALVSPNGGEDWKAGTHQTIRWSYTGNPGKHVTIGLLKDGKLDHKISDKTPIDNDGNGSYKWKIPKSQASGTGYKIRITSTSNSSYTDTSDNSFTISK